MGLIIAGISSSGTIVIVKFNGKSFISVVAAKSEGRLIFISS
jgi:hypothetical protein